LNHPDQYRVDVARFWYDEIDSTYVLKSISYKI